jgi:glutathione peroxidase-family protein
MWKIKITDPMMKLKTNSNSIKGLRIKIKNQKIEGQTWNIIKSWIEKKNQIHKRIQNKNQNQESEDQIKKKLKKLKRSKSKSIILNHWSTW